MSLTQAAVGGVRWTTLSMILVTITQVIRLVVLGRILGPEAFGLLAMMLVVIGFAELFAQMGLSEAIIQRPNPTDIELSSLYWLNIALGGLLYVVLLLITPAVAALYSTPELNQLLPWVALAFLISPWGVQFKALLQKQLQFKPLAIIEIFAVVVGTVLAIMLAWKGYGVWSLVWGQLAQSSVIALSLVFVGWQRKMLPSFYFNYMAVKSYLSFGLHLMGANVLNYFNSRIDQLVIGVLLGSQALGYYSMAFNLVLQPISKINPVLTQVAFPILAKVSSDKVRLKRGYFRMLDLLTSINAPVLMGVAAMAPVLIPVVLGEQWLPIVPLIQVLALFSLIRSTGNAGGSLLLACGRADWSFYWNLMLFTFIPLTIFIGAKVGGLQGVAWSLLGLQALLLFAWYYSIVKRLLGNCFSGFIGSMIKPVIFAVPMVGVVVGITPLLSTLPAVAQLTLQVLFGGATYVGLYFVFRKEFVKEQLQLFFKR
ncbi:MAG: MOP flippase family protein [Gammaproteobacteria bacterium]|nr:MOP flippase family protein [Gammaproteobacteria bacterium]